MTTPDPITARLIARAEGVAAEARSWSSSDRTWFDRLLAGAARRFAEASRQHLLEGLAAGRPELELRLEVLDLARGGDRTTHELSREFFVDGERRRTACMAAYVATRAAARLQYLAAFGQAAPARGSG